MGGAGANITTTLNVTPGQVLYIVVGGFPGQSTTAKYGYGGNGGLGTNYGGAGGGLSGVFTSTSPAITNALVVAGGGGGGSGNALGSDFTGGNAGNTSSGTSSNGNEPANSTYITNSKYQYGYAATNSGPGSEGEPYDVVAGTRGTSGNDINGGNGGTDGGIGTWNGAGGGGAGFYGGGGGAGGGAACGGGAGGATKSTGLVTTYGTANSIGDGSVTITCISNSGMVLNLDAGNPASYSGSGTIWNDLSGNGSNASLISTTYNSGNGGHFIFDGTNSYVNFSANVSSAPVVTVEMWANVTNVGASNMNGMMFGFTTYDVWTNNGSLGFNCGNGVLYGINSTTFSPYWGNWQHYVFVMYAGNNNSSNKIYLNKVSQTMGIPNPGSGWSPTNAVFDSGIGRISGWRIDNSYKINMKVASFRIYNRELTPQEIINNFNAQKARFGL